VRKSATAEAILQSSDFTLCGRPTFSIYYFSIIFLFYLKSKSNSCIYVPGRAPNARAEWRGLGVEGLRGYISRSAQIKRSTHSVTLPKWTCGGSYNG